MANSGTLPFTIYNMIISMDIVYEFMIDYYNQYQDHILFVLTDSSYRLVKFNILNYLIRLVCLDNLMKVVYPERLVSTKASQTGFNQLFR